MCTGSSGEDHIRLYAYKVIMCTGSSDRRRSCWFVCVQDHQICGDDHVILCVYKVMCVYRVIRYMEMIVSVSVCTSRHVYVQGHQIHGDDHVSFCVYKSSCVRTGSSDRSGDGLSFEANSLRQSKRKRKPPSALEEAAGGSAGGSWVRAASK